MNRAELIRRFRHDTLDLAEPYLWSSEWVIDALDDAISEAAIRGRLLYAVDDPALCVIDIQAGRAVYPLHPALYELVWLHVSGGHSAHAISLASVEDMDERDYMWRERSGDVRWAIQNEHTLRLVPTPTTDGQLKLEGYRLPLTRMVDGDDDSEPEIHPASHRMLLEWVKHKAYLVPDTDAMDVDRAKLAHDAFESYFGRRPNSDLRRSTRIDEVHHNKAYL